MEDAAVIAERISRLSELNKRTLRIASVEGEVFTAEVIAQVQSIIDRVIFTGGTNSLEWPKVSGKQAIELEGTINDAAANNFGRNWKAATALIEGTAGQYGTPHIR